MHHTPWILTRSGTAFPLVHPTPADVDWRDIATALARQPRFGGHTTAWWSVASHCLVVCRIVAESLRQRANLLWAAPEADRAALVATLDHAATVDDAMAGRLLLAALLHDAHEAYIGDITAPLSRLLAERAGRDLVGEVKADLDAAIHAAAGLPWPLPAGWRAAISAADAIALATERRDLMPPGPPWGHPLPPPCRFTCRPQPEHLAADAWLHAVLWRMNPDLATPSPLAGEGRGEGDGATERRACR